MSNLQRVTDDSVEKFDLYKNMREINELLLKLADIYKGQLPNMIPIEILQCTYGLELCIKVLLNQRQDPHAVIAWQIDYINDLTSIYLSFVKHCALVTAPSKHKHPTEKYKQFAHDAWHCNPTFNLLKNLHLFSKRVTHDWLHSLNGVNHKTKEQLHFYITNFLDMLAPTNNMCTNPEVLETIIATSGMNLIQGYKNYLEDLVLNDGKLNVRMTDVSAFKVGENLAITPGKVIYQNDLMQLIQYEPTTEQVYKNPILITPPFINKYYVLDLSPKNSLVKWLVAQGFTVYMISWVNPGAEMAETAFEDYLKKGTLAALDVVCKSANVTAVHMVGYCIGGTVLACTLAYLKSKNDNRALSATFFMSLVNFSDPGEIGVFLDETQLDSLERMMKSSGYLSGRLLDMTFNLLRPNDLVWPYFINDYLLGKNTRPFDILFWNADSVNLPYKMYNFYLRNMYLHNNLIKAGGITLCDVPIDLSTIDTPAIFLAAESDHITLWHSIYRGIRSFSGPVELILTESGHVRGVLNPEGDTKYNFMINNEYKDPNVFKKHKPHEWLQTATEQQGSWWPFWHKWLLQYGIDMVAARTIPASSVIEDAPGSYVKRRI